MVVDRSGLAATLWWNDGLSGARKWNVRTQNRPVPGMNWGLVPSGSVRLNVY